MSRALAFGNPPIAVDLRRSRRARRLSLRVSRLDGKITLTLPQRTPEREALRFLAAREDWLRRHLDQVSPRIVVAPGTTIPFRGRPIRVRSGEGRTPQIEGGELCVPGASDMAGVRVQAFLKQQARDALALASDRYAARLDRRYTKLTLRDTRSRWGSCSSRGGLMYSWRLIMAPPEVLDYVAAHEVAHLVEMNHAPAFWEIVARLVPDYADRRRWLRENGSDLHRYCFAD